MKSNGKCRIDGVEVGEISADLMLPVKSISVKFAYKDSVNGRNCGFGFQNVWGEETLNKFRSFIEAAEADIIATMFEGGEVISNSSPVEEIPEEGVDSL
jgi:hypothetical protein